MAAAQAQAHLLAQAQAQKVLAVKAQEQAAKQEQALAIKAQAQVQQAMHHWVAEQAQEKAQVQAPEQVLKAQAPELVLKAQTLAVRQLPQDQIGCPQMLKVLHYLMDVQDIPGAHKSQTQMVAIKAHLLACLALSHPSYLAAPNQVL